MKNVTIGVILLLTLLSGEIYGQSPSRKKIIEGRVTDGYGHPIAGANILLKGTTTGTMTDFEGKYKIELDSAKQTLLVSFVGYASMEKQIEYNSEQKIIANFSLGTEALELFGWCCTDHIQPNGPHCGDNQSKLTEKFGCKKFKRDN